MVSKMFKFYSRLIGLPYLYTTIGPEIDKLIFDQIGLEVDPEKMEEGTDLDEMRWKLMAESQKILKEIFNSADQCPPYYCFPFNLLLICLLVNSESCFPTSNKKSVPSFLATYSPLLVVLSS